MGFFVLRPPLRPDPRSAFGPSRLGSTRERRVFDRQPPRHLPRPLVGPDGRVPTRLLRASRSYRHTFSRKHSADHVARIRERHR